MSKLLLALIILTAVTSAFGGDITEKGTILFRVYAGPGLAFYRPHVDWIPGVVTDTRFMAAIGATLGYHTAGVDILNGTTVIWSEDRYNVWVETDETTALYFNSCSGGL